MEKEREQILKESCRRKPFTMDQLVVEAARLIPHFVGRQRRYHVSIYPDERTIRYYILKGLVDKSSGYQGAAATFGVHHLLQVVAIKKLQAEYLSLYKVKEIILGLSTNKLRNMLLQGREEFPPARLIRPQYRRSNLNISEEPSGYLLKEDPAPYSFLEAPIAKRSFTRRALPEKWLRFPVTNELELHLQADSSLAKNKAVLERLMVKLKLLLEKEKGQGSKGKKKRGKDGKRRKNGNRFFEGSRAG